MVQVSLSRRARKSFIEARRTLVSKTRTVKPAKNLIVVRLSLTLRFGAEPFRADSMGPRVA